MHERALNPEAASDIRVCHFVCVCGMLVRSALGQVVKGFVYFFVLCCPQDPRCMLLFRDRKGFDTGPAQ